MRTVIILTSLVFLALWGGCTYMHMHSLPLPVTTQSPIATTTDQLARPVLSPQAISVLYHAGTEAPFSSPLDFETRKGTYVTADTGLPVFRSEDKYDSGTGWPSFTKPISPDVLVLRRDSSLLGETRTEVLSSDTHVHLGHVFDDGPPPLGKRYCMNGVALRFIPDTIESSSTRAH